MTFIPETTTDHAQAEPLDAEGKVIPIEVTAPETSTLGWVLGAVGAGVAVAAGAAALLSLRSSSSRKPARRRAARKGPAKAAKPATRSRRTTKKATAAA